MGKTSAKCGRPCPPGFTAKVSDAQEKVSSARIFGCGRFTCRKKRNVKCPIKRTCPPGYTGELSYYPNGCPRITCKKTNNVNGEEYCESSALIRNREECIRSSCCHWNVDEPGKASFNHSGRCWSSIRTAVCNDISTNSLAETDTQSDESAVSYTADELKRTNTMLKEALLALTEAN